MQSSTTQKLIVRCVIVLAALIAFVGIIRELHPTPELALTLYTAMIAFFTFILTRPIDQSPPGPPEPPI